MIDTQSTRTDYRAVRAWTADLLDRAHRTGPIPAPGSPDWRALDDRDPRKPAALIRAALAWLYEATPEVIAARLRAELDQLDRAKAEQVKDIASDLSGAANWSRIAASPTAVQLAERRARPGPLAEPVDPAETERWVRTGNATPHHDTWFEVAA